MSKSVRMCQMEGYLQFLIHGSIWEQVPDLQEDEGRVAKHGDVEWQVSGQRLFRIFILLTLLITARKRSLRRLCFYICLSVHGGGGGIPVCLAGFQAHT